MDGTELERFRVETLNWANGNLPPKRKQYFSLAFEDYIPMAEIAVGVGCELSTIKCMLYTSRNRILDNAPHLQNMDLAEHRAAGRMLNLLATECDRKSGVGGDINYQQIFSEITRVVDDELTTKQHRVYSRYFLRGMTQTLIAEMFGLCQPSIHKTIWGNWAAGYNKYHGGIISKIGKELRRNQVPYCCHLINPYGKLLNFLLN